MNILVGSTNPVKIAAVEEAVKRIWPDKNTIVSGVSAPSDVRDQPMSSEEAILGARNRASFCLAQDKTANLAVGLEACVTPIADEWFCVGWVVIIDRKGTEGIGSSIQMKMPAEFMRLINEGSELGTACEIIFEQEHTKQGKGFFGLMSNGAIGRTASFSDAAVAAFTAFLHPELF